MASVTELLAREWPIWVAWLVLVTGNLALAILLPNDHHWILEQGVLSRLFLLTSLGIALAYAYLVLLIRCVRGSGRRSKSQLPIHEQTLGPWGYIWRSYLVLLLTIFPLFSWSLSFLMMGREVPRVPQWALWLLFVLAPPLITWLVFGRNRLTTMKRFFGHSGSGADDV